jgi:hypothetical protein
MQGPQVNTQTLHDKVNEFMKNLESWETRNVTFLTCFLLLKYIVPAMNTDANNYFYQTLGTAQWYNAVLRAG